MVREQLRYMARLLMIGLVVAVVGSGAELVTRKTLTLEVAKQLAAAAEEHAVKNEWNVVIAILDDGGHPLYLQRMDGVQIGSIEVALRKAQSAVYFKRPSKVFGDALSGGRTALVSLPGAMPFEGGVPIEWEGQILGAIGVSGVTAEQDGMIAQAGADALKEALGE